jgi:hypothetical protein
VDWRIVQGQLPRGHLLRFRPEFAAEVWPAAEDARFASEVGLPYCRGLFRIQPELAVNDPDSPRMAFLPPLPDGASLQVDTEQGRLQRLGSVFGARLYVGLEDGRIWVKDPDGYEDHELIHGDLSSLAYLLYKLDVERPAEANPTPRDWLDAEGFIREDTTRWDPIPFADKDGYWERFLEHWATI